MNNEKIIAIIPARGGSKRIKRKNIKKFHNKPIISYSINQAKKSKLFDRIIVSTDDVEIADISKEYGAEVPFMRPKSISDDYATLGQVQEHAINELQFDGKYICMILPTAPMIQSQYILKGFKEVQKNEIVFSFSACSMPFTVERTFIINEKGTCTMHNPKNFKKRSQDFPESFQDAAQFYWTNLENYSISKSEILFGLKSVPIIIPRYMVQDIDTKEDWESAEVLYKVMNELNEKHSN